MLSPWRAGRRESARLTSGEHEHHDRTGLCWTKSRLHAEIRSPAAPPLPSLQLVLAQLRLAEGARRAVLDPQHGLAGTQGDLALGRAVLGSLRLDERLYPAEVGHAGEMRWGVGRCEVHPPQEAGRPATR